jgi:hypothetical protein
MLSKRVQKLIRIALVLPRYHSVVLLERAGGTVGTNRSHADDHLALVSTGRPRLPVRSVAVRPGSTALNFTFGIPLAYCTVIIATAALLEPYSRATRWEAGCQGCGLPRRSRASLSQLDEAPTWSCERESRNCRAGYSFLEKGHRDLSETTDFFARCTQDGWITIGFGPVVPVLSG